MPRLDAVDLSEFNPGVEYEKLHADGVRFAWIRVWSGSAFDPMRETHRNGCKAAGILAFPYWVADPMQDANSQGGLARQHCESDVWDTWNGHPLWALDWEMAGLNLAWAQRFGQPPVLYRSYAHENVYPDAHQWIADWGLDTPPMVKNMIAWQWTDKLEGYRKDGGPLDGSECFLHNPASDGGNKAVNEAHYEHLHKHIVHLTKLVEAVAAHVGLDLKLDKADAAEDTAETPATPGETPAPESATAETPAAAEPATPAAPTADAAPPATASDQSPSPSPADAVAAPTPTDDAGGTPSE